MKIEEREERPTAKSRLRSPVTIPASEFSLRFSDLEQGKLVHELPVDIYTDTVSLRFVRREAPLEQSFEFVDPAVPEQGDYYYVRATQADNAMAWSSPVWMGAVPR